MNISKSKILNPESGDNAAVKLALAESHIIQGTKTYSESQGVLLSSVLGPTLSWSKNSICYNHWSNSWAFWSSWRIEQGTGTSSWHNGGRKIRETGWGCQRILSGCVSVACQLNHLPRKGTFRDVRWKLHSHHKPQTVSSAIWVPKQSVSDISKSTDDDQDLTIQYRTTLYLKNLAFSTT